MLQPVELQEVAGRFAGQIASLRRFFSHAAISLDAGDSAQQVVARMLKDRAFHRDLGSHIWVLLDESDGALQYADLLAIVSVAAAGVEVAAAIHEDTAHALLRFLMEAKHSFEGKPQRVQVEAVGSRGESVAGHPVHAAPEPNTESAAAAGDRRGMPQHASSRIPGTAASVVRVEPSPAPSRKSYRFVWMAAGVVAIALLLVLWSRSKAPEPGDVTLTSSADTAHPNDNSGRPQDHTAQTRSDAERPLFRADNSNRTQTASVPHTGLSLHSLLHPFSAKNRIPAPIVSTPASSAQPGTSTSAAGFVTSTAIAPPSLDGNSVGSRSATAAQPSGTPTDKAARSPAAVIAVPADALSRQLDSPRLPAYASDSYESSQRKYPRLLRRRAYDSGAAGTSPDPVLTAEMRAPDLTGAAGRTLSAASPHTEVRATVVGMMAGNLVYGPSPQYPAGAASARVQGQVKIQATIDRDGTINSARVISGPPPLRDAALNAVQQWRFKPFLSGGKATPSATMAVVEFELQ